MRLRAPWRRRHDSSPTPPRPAVRTPSAAAWRTLPPLRTVVPAHVDTVAAPARFRAALATTWQQPPALGRLQHLVLPDAPAGLVTGRPVPVEGYHGPPLTFARSPAAAEPEPDARPGLPRRLPGRHQPLPPDAARAAAPAAHLHGEPTTAAVQPAHALLPPAEPGRGAVRPTLGDRVPRPAARPTPDRPDPDPPTGPALGRPATGLRPGHGTEAREPHRTSELLGIEPGDQQRWMPLPEPPVLRSAGRLLDVGQDEPAAVPDLRDAATQAHDSHPSPAESPTSVTEQAAGSRRSGSAQDAPSTVAATRTEVVVARELVGRRPLPMSLAAPTGPLPAPVPVAPGSGPQPLPAGRDAAPTASTPADPWSSRPALPARAAPLPSGSRVPAVPTLPAGPAGALAPTPTGAWRRDEEPGRPRPAREQQPAADLAALVAAVPAGPVPSLATGLPDWWPADGAPAAELGPGRAPDHVPIDEPAAAAARHDATGTGLVSRPSGPPARRLDERPVDRAASAPLHLAGVLRRVRRTAPGAAPDGPLARRVPWPGPGEPDLLRLSGVPPQEIPASRPDVPGPASRPSAPIDPAVDRGQRPDAEPRWPDHPVPRFPDPAPPDALLADRPAALAAAPAPDDGWQHPTPREESAPEPSRQQPATAPPTAEDVASQVRHALLVDRERAGSLADLW